MSGARIVLFCCCFSISPSILSYADTLTQREGRYLRLITDLESSQQIDSLIESFDTAVAQWIEFWQLDDSALDSWKVVGCVMGDKAAFQRDGLLPESLPAFPFGYTTGNRIWVVAQPSQYYTRHLLLHEGAHALAFHVFGGAGPTWFMEGTAELLATHSGAGSTTTINQIPTSREAAPYWGRFKRMQQARATDQVPALETVMRYAPTLTGDVAQYGWSWAAASLLHAYPEYRPHLLSAAANGGETGPAFNRKLFQQLRSHWPVLNARWRLLTHDFDYGFDWPAQRVELSARDPVWQGEPVEVEIHANLGWQSIGVRIPGPSQIRISAAGQVVLATEPKPWISEPPGVTIRYHRGQPLGKLIACILPNAAPATELLPPLQVVAVGQGLSLDVDQFCWLLLRVNEAPAELADNHASYQVRVTR